MTKEEWDRIVERLKALDIAPSEMPPRDVLRIFNESLAKAPRSLKDSIIRDLKELNTREDWFDIEDKIKSEISPKPLKRTFRPPAPSIFDQSLQDPQPPKWIPKPKPWAKKDWDAAVRWLKDQGVLPKSFYSEWLDQLGTVGGEFDINLSGTAEQQRLLTELMLQAGRYLAPNKAKIIEGLKKLNKGPVKDEIIKGLKGLNEQQKLLTYKTDDPQFPERTPFSPEEVESYVKKQEDFLERMEKQPYIDVTEGKPMTKYGGTQRPSLAKQIIKQHGTGKWVEGPRLRDKPKTAGMDYKRGHKPRKKEFAQAIANVVYGGDTKKVSKHDIKHFERTWEQNLYGQLTDNDIRTILKNAAGYESKNLAALLGLETEKEAQQLLKQFAVELELRKLQTKGIASRKATKEKLSTTGKDKALGEQASKFRTDLTRTEASKRRMEADLTAAATPAARRTLENGIVAANKRIKELKQNIKSLKPKGIKGKGKAGLLALLAFGFLSSSDEEQNSDFAHAAINLTMLLNARTGGKWSKWVANPDPINKNNMMLALEAVEDTFEQYELPKRQYTWDLTFEEELGELTRAIDQEVFTTLSLEEREALRNIHAESPAALKIGAVDRPIESVQDFMEDLLDRQGIVQDPPTQFESWSEGMGKWEGGRHGIPPAGHPESMIIPYRKPYGKPAIASIPYSKTPTTDMLLASYVAEYLEFEPPGWLTEAKAITMVSNDERVPREMVEAAVEKHGSTWHPWMDEYPRSLYEIKGGGTAGYDVEIGKIPYEKPATTMTPPFDPETGRPLHSFYTPEQEALMKADAELLERHERQARSRSVWDVERKDPGEIDMLREDKRRFAGHGRQGRVLPPPDLPPPDLPAPRPPGGGRPPVIGGEHYQRPRRGLRLVDPLDPEAVAEGEAAYLEEQRLRERRRQMLPMADIPEAEALAERNRILDARDAKIRQLMKEPSSPTVVEPIRIPERPPLVGPARGAFRPSPHWDSFIEKAKNLGYNREAAMMKEFYKDPKNAQKINRVLAKHNIRGAVGAAMVPLIGMGLHDIFTDDKIPWYDDDPRAYTKDNALADYIAAIATYGGTAGMQIARHTKERMAAGEHIDAPRWARRLANLPEAWGSVLGYETPEAYTWDEPIPYAQDVYEDDTARAAELVKQYSGKEPTQHGASGRFAGVNVPRRRKQPPINIPDPFTATTNVFTALGLYDPEPPEATYGEVAEATGIPFIEKGTVAGDLPMDWEEWKKGSWIPGAIEEQMEPPPSVGRIQGSGWTPNIITARKKAAEELKKRQRKKHLSDVSLGLEGSQK